MNLTRPDLNYPSCLLVGRHLTFRVATKSNIAWVELVFPTWSFGRL